MGVVYLARDPLIGRLVALKTFRIGYSVNDQEWSSSAALHARGAERRHPDPSQHRHHPRRGRGERGRGRLHRHGVRARHQPEAAAPGRRCRSTAVRRRHHRARWRRRSTTPTPTGSSTATSSRRTSSSPRTTGSRSPTSASPGSTARTSPRRGSSWARPTTWRRSRSRARRSDHRADIFSLGVVLYEMLTRHKPFQGENLTVVSHRIVYDHFTPPEEYVRGLPPGVDKVLSRALEKDPARRYQRAREMADDLAASWACGRRPRWSSSRASTRPRASRPPRSCRRSATVGGTSHGLAARCSTARERAGAARGQPGSSSRPPSWPAARPPSSMLPSAPRCCSPSPGPALRSSRPTRRAPR